MSHYINALQNTLKTKLVGAVMGPVRESQMYDERTFTHMHVFDWHVANGSSLVHPLPFGMFAEISPENVSVSRLRILVAPGYFAGTPVFNEVCSKQQGISELICSATVCHKVVAIDAAIESGTTIWSSTITPLDEVHGMRVTVKNPVLVAQTGSEWNEALNQFLNTTQILVTAYATPSLVVSGDVATYTYTTPVKCGWWLQRAEVFTVATVARTFNTTDNFYWPAILREVEFMNWERRPTTQQEEAGYNGGVDIFPRLYFNPEAYNGPTKTRVEISWSGTPQTITELNPMRPDRLVYGAPFYNVNCPECLHPSWTFQCDIGSNDPTYIANFGSGRTFPATNYTEWPDEIVGTDEQIPFKGGYLRTKRTFYPPEHTTTNTPGWGTTPTVPTIVVVETPTDLTDTTLTVETTVADADYPVNVMYRLSTTPNFSNGVSYVFGTGSATEWYGFFIALLPETTYYVSAMLGYHDVRLDGSGNFVGFIAKWTGWCPAESFTTEATP